MFSGLAMMAAGAVMLWQQSHQTVVLAEPPRPAEQQAPGKASAKPAAGDAEASKDLGWKDLFDGKTLEGWKAPQFGGEGKVSVKDGRIVMEMGSMMTGIVKTGDVVRDNYELSLEGMRISGNDFFCTTTFPVGKDQCSFVVGGWGGAVVGLSSIDHADASENSTTKTMGFKSDRWYRVRIRVNNAAIEAWIDDEKMVDQPRKDHKIGIRIECEACCPLGVSTWCTAGAVRNIRVRPLKPDEIRTIQQEHDRAAKDDY
jgi:hypothetical protein